MATINVSQHENTNDEQFLYAESLKLYIERSSTETDELGKHQALRFPEGEFETTERSIKESGIEAPSKNEKLISPALRQTQRLERGIGVSQYRTYGLRRCGGLSEY